MAGTNFNNIVTIGIGTDVIDNQEDLLTRNVNLLTLPKKWGACTA